MQYGIRLLPTLKRWAILKSPSGTEETPQIPGGKSFLMVTILSCNRPLASPEFFSLAKFRADGQKPPLRFR